MSYYTVLDHCWYSSSRQFMLGLATSCPTLGSSCVIDHHLWHSLSRQSPTCLQFVAFCDMQENATIRYYRSTYWRVKSAPYLLFYYHKMCFKQTNSMKISCSCVVTSSIQSREKSPKPQTVSDGIITSDLRLSDVLSLFSLNRLVCK